MKKLIFVCLLMTTSIASYSQNYYRSKKSGNYNSTSTWESSSDSSTWISSTTYPNGVSKNVVIQSGHTITTPSPSTINVKNLTVNGSFTLANGIGSPKNLIINGELINNGVLNHNYSKVTFSGSTDNNISGSQTTLFYIISIDKSSNNTINVKSNVLLEEMLTFGTTSTNILNVVSPNNFTFLSNSTKTAHIDILSSPLPVMSGNYTVQRFFPAQVGRYLFMLGTPLANVTVSMLQPTSFDVNNYPTNGIFITGPFIGTNVDNGTGMNISNYSAASYSPTTGLYSGYPVSSNTEILTQGKGYRFSVRDGGSSINTTVNKLLSVKGVPTIGDFTFTGLVNGLNTKPFASGTLTGINAPITGGWNLVSNPYVSDISIDLSNNWVLNDMSQTAYIYDAANRNFLPCASGVPTENCIISQFQGFFVQATGNSPSLTINETAKINDQNISNVFRIANTSEKLNYFGITLSNNLSYDKTYIRFKNGSVVGNDIYDGYKLGVNDKHSLTQTSIYSKYDSIYYDVNSKSNNFFIDTTEIYVQSVASNYTLDFSDINNLELGYNISLYDKYLKKLTNVSSTSLYDFTINHDSSSFGNRFQVIVENQITPINDKSIQKSISVSPNPFKTTLSINTQFIGDINVIITDIVGNIVYSGSDRLFTPNVSEGVYIIKVYYDNKIFTDKLIK